MNSHSRQYYLQQRDARREAIRIQKEAANKLCYNCYRPGHIRFERCPNAGIIACSKCFQLNVFTNSCQCENPTRIFPGQTLRLVGNPKAPRIYIDVNIYGYTFYALYNSSLTMSRIDHNLSKWLFEVEELIKENVDRNAKTLEVPICRRGHTRILECEVVKYNLYTLELGQDYVYQEGFSFTFDGLTINKKSTPIIRHPDEVNYVYNIPGIGKWLRKYFEKHNCTLKKPKRLTEKYGPPKRKSQTVAIESSTDDVLDLHPDGDIEDLLKI